MQDDDFHHILIPTTVEIIRASVEKYQQLNGNFDDGLVKMDEEQSYLYSYWQILTSLIDEKCNVNIGKLTKTFPFENLTHFII